MPEFIKPKEFFEKNNNKMVFQPTTKDGTERFSIWAVSEKKFYNGDDELTIDGETKKVDGKDSWKYTKLTDEQKKRYNRTLKIQREVIVDGEKYLYDMPPTANKELEKTMENVEKMGGDSLGMTYVLSRVKTGDNAWNIEYNVSVGEKVSDSVSVDIDVPEPEIDLDVEDETLTLTDIENKYVETIKKKYPDYASKEASVWSNILVEKISISKDRANSIVKNFLR